MEWSWTASPATVLSLLANLALVVAFIWRRSSAETTAAAQLTDAHKRIDALSKDFNEARSDRDRWREQWRENYERGRDDFRRNVESSIGAVTAGMTLSREQASEFKTEAARTFATKMELREEAGRLAGGLERVNDRLDHLSKQLQDMSTEILTAVRTAQLRAPS